MLAANLAGKSTLARRLAETDALGLPLLDRDAIKVGLVMTHGMETDEETMPKQGLRRSCQ
ncbi:MAG: hypothetical protein M3380_21795 [Chloroflexota bacterium]|nr:hypothetical protein [Chloroflexota bacterium]